MSIDVNEHTDVGRNSWVSMPDHQALMTLRVDYRARGIPRVQRSREVNCCFDCRLGLRSDHNNFSCS